MEGISGFLNKWGSLIAIIILMFVFMNTCGLKTKIDRTNKRIDSLEQTMSYDDSLSKEIDYIEKEIIMYETAREITYNWNAIIRTAVRPDDIMNTYSEKIKGLQQKRNLLNAKRK